jgi:pyridoxal phosphate enzyme (YggS family)
MDRSSEIRDNLDKVRNRIAATAQRSGRRPEAVTLVGVSKTHPAGDVLAAVAAGLRHLGENRVAELSPKLPEVEDQLGAGANELTWHMIGHVQSRKAADVAQSADFVHSLDSLKLARRLDRFAGELGRTLPVLFQVNVSGEESKYGIPAYRWESDEGQWKELTDLVEATLALPHLQVQGLMTMAPWVPDEAVIRPVFRSARRLMERLVSAFPSADWRHLSMGMTDDFEIAIEEGATMVRVGRAIFGARN